MESAGWDASEVRVAEEAEMESACEDASEVRVADEAESKSAGTDKLKPKMKTPERFTLPKSGPVGITEYVEDFGQFFLHSIPITARNLVIPSREVKRFLSDCKPIGRREKTFYKLLGLAILAKVFDTKTVDGGLRLKNGKPNILGITEHLLEVRNEMARNDMPIDVDEDEEGLSVANVRFYVESALRSLKVKVETAPEVSIGHQKDV